jgi:hypothetical protein
MLQHMKAVTIHLDETAYRDFQHAARKQRRTASQLIREAMESYRRSLRSPRHRLCDAPDAVSVGSVLKPWSSRGDLLEDFLS